MPRRVWSTARARRSLALLLVATGCWLGGVQAAHALTMTVPAEVLRSADVTITLDASDPAGTVALSVDGSVVGTAAVTAGGEVAFSSLRLAQGTRTLTATLAESGGAPTSAAPVQVVVWDVPDTPALVSPNSGLAAGLVDVVARAGRSTSVLTVLLDGAPVGSRTCVSGQTVGFGYVWTEPGWHRVTVVAANPYGEEARGEWAFNRLGYPAATCIVVDKSDFRLYWIRDNVLVGIYPVAIGKRRTPTPNAMWIVGRREYMPPRGVYGPRRLKLSRLVSYRRRGRRYVRYKLTGYGIHGTNQPWVIGTMASHGCIRLTNDMILNLWPQVPLGTVVQTRQ